ncbi:MAG TPA: hypothetical protein PKA58_02470 [Polyangium sp.]|nr:hypothetical protein [Polyangium sp.]
MPLDAARGPSVHRPLRTQWFAQANHWGDVPARLRDERQATDEGSS